MQSAECREYLMRIAECRVRSKPIIPSDVECRVRMEECGVQNKIQNGEYRMQSAEQGMRSTECAVRIAE